VNGTTNQANRQIARAAGTVMLAFALSQVAGLTRQILVTNAFGTNPAMDAYNAANSFPTLIFTLVAGGALASAFVPTFTALLTRSEGLSAWRLASSITNLVTLLLTALSFVSVIFAPQIVHLLWPKYEQGTTIRLLRILLITPAIFGVSGIVSGVLNAHQRFFLPALASTMYWLGIIFGLIFFVPSMGIYGLAWGAVLGSVMHLSIQIPDLLRLPKRHYIPTLGLREPSVREVGMLMGPRLLGVATVQLNFLVNTIIANFLPLGSLAAIGYAFPIMTMPLVVIGSAIGFATLPTFSAQAARGEFGELRDSLTASLRGVLLLSIPATFGLILLREPLITALFQHGNFTALSTEMVSWALLWYTVGLVGHATLEIVARAFYALHDTKTPALVGAGSMVLNIALSILFAYWFDKIGQMPLGGLALSASVAVFLETGTLFILLGKRLKAMQGKKLAQGTGAALLGALVMSASIVLWLQSMKSCSALITTLGGVVMGGIVYGLTLVVLRVPEVHNAVRALRQRFSQ